MQQQRTKNLYYTTETTVPPLPEVDASVIERAQRLAAAATANR